MGTIRHPVRRRLGGLGGMLLAVLLFLTAMTAPAYAQRLDQASGPNSPASKDEVQLYQAPEKVVGITSIPDPKASVLVQPEGRHWREFRNTNLRIIAAVVMFGMIAVLALFYFWRGTIRISAGRSGLTITRFHAFERFVHWTTAISFIVLALTGLVILFGRLVLLPLMGHDAFSALTEVGKLAHNFFGVPFFLGIALMFVLWIKDNIPEKADITWIKQGGGFLGKGSHHPEAGKFNAGQKMIFWTVVGGGAVMAVTGWMLEMPFYVTGIGGMQIMHVIHGLLAGLLIAVIFGHIYIGTLGMEGAFDAMSSGEVDENWAQEHHSRWYKEARARRRAVALGLDEEGRRAAGAD